MIKLILKFLIEYYEYVTGVPVRSESTENLLSEKEESQSDNVNSENHNILKVLKSKKFLSLTALLAAAGGMFIYDPNGVIILFVCLYFKNF